MFRKLVIIGIVIGMAGMAMSAKYIGNPTSANHWSTTSKVTCTTAGQIGDPCIFQLWTNGAPHNLIDGNGLDPTGQKHATEDWIGRSEDSNAQWNCAYVLTNNNRRTATPDDPNTYTFIAPPYDSDMTTVPFVWFAFEFDTTYYIGDMLVWNFSEVPTTVPMPPGGSYKDMYNARKIVASYTTDDTSWNEKMLYTLSAGNRMSWTRGDDQQYADKVPIDGYANKVVINVLRFPDRSAVRAGLGEVRFEYDPNRATAPTPLYRQQGSTPTKFVNVPLQWTAGKGSNITKHKVYLSTDVNAVNNRTAPSAIVTTTSYAPPGIVIPKTAYLTYSWAVDELDASNNVVTEGTGRTWKFNSNVKEGGSSNLASYVGVAKVDDFESYTIDTGSNPIYDTWVDGWVSSGNYKNGGWVQMLYNSGYQQMKLNYDNDGAWNDEYPTPWGPIDVNYSEVTAKASDLAIGADWTVGDVKAIWVWFTSDTGNDSNEPLSMILTDNSSNSASVLYPTKSHLKDGATHAWRIDLADFTDAGVDISDINTVTIRIGDGGSISGTGNGTLLFDDFRLYQPVCENLFGTTDPTKAFGDLNSDCVVDIKDLAYVVNNWLISGTSP